MKKTIESITVSLVVITLSVLGFIFNPIYLSNNQKETLLILLIVCGSSALYCFVVGEISRNNSQMDKLWSILPIAYTWIIAFKSGFDPRQVIYQEPLQGQGRLHPYERRRQAARTAVQGAGL